MLTTKPFLRILAEGHPKQLREKRKELRMQCDYCNVKIATTEEATAVHDKGNIFHGDCWAWINRPAAPTEAEVKS